MGDSSATGVKLSLAGRKQHKVSFHEEKKQTARDLITGVSETGQIQLVDNGQEKVNGPLVIRKLANTFQGAAKKAPRFIPTIDDEAAIRNAADKFEVAAPEAERNVQYGLQQRNPNAEANNGSTKASTQEQSMQRFKEDMDRLPSMSKLEDYERMPIEEFGKAMLRGMGWDETKDSVQAVEYVRRPQRLGLGAQPAAMPPPDTRRFIRPGETREPKKDMVYLDAEGKQKHVKAIDDKLVERPKEGVNVGKTMLVVKGKHEGLRCVILAVEPKIEGRSDRATVRLLPSEATETIRCKDIGELSDGFSKKESWKKDKSRDCEADELHASKKQRKADRNGSQHFKDKYDSDADEQEDDERDERPWLLAHIRVKVIDKKLKKGRLYLKKGTVMDIVAPKVCDVQLDETREVVQLSQSQLETVVPRQEGAPLMILQGEHRGQPAKLLQRNTESGLAAVQLHADFSIHKLLLDDVAQYVGEDM